MTRDFYAAADGPKRPPGQQLAWRNRSILAERLRWPASALETCERIERTHPGWSISWRHENPFRGFERPAGYWAMRSGIHEVEVSAADPDELVRLIEDSSPAEHTWTVEGCQVCLAREDERMRRARLRPSDDRTNPNG